MWLRVDEGVTMNDRVEIKTFSPQSLEERARKLREYELGVSPQEGKEKWKCLSERLAAKGFA